MRRSTVRFFAVMILAVLGAPLVLHVILHDHGHEAGDVVDLSAPHGDHDHPIVSSSPPQLPALTAAMTEPILSGPQRTQEWACVAQAARNAVSHGAVRLDNDVGLQQLLSTFLI